MESKRDDDYADAAQALCNATHPSLTRSGTRYCSRCSARAGVVILKLEELGWKDAEAIRDDVSNAMDEG